MVAGVLRPLRLPRVPCSPEGVGDVGRVAPPRTLVSSSDGVVGASSAWFLVGVVVVMAGRRNVRTWGAYLLLWASRCGDLGCPPVGGTMFSGGR